MTFRHIGVYAIINASAHRAYVGSSIDVFKRLSTHKRELKRNKHHCVHLQRAWNKYGEEAFYWDVFDLGKSTVPLVEREQVFIDMFWDSKNLYNTCRVAGSCLGIKQSQSTKDKRAEKLRGSTRSPEQKARISAARKAVGITPDHAKLLAELASLRRYKMSSEDRMMYLERIAAGETQKAIAASVPINIKAFRRELKNLAT